MRGGKGAAMIPTYYCPRGCNQCSEEAVLALGLECGACGCIMTTDSRRYDAVHEEIEARLTAEMEERNEEDKQPQ
jgi:hypothetical protein